MAHSALCTTPGPPNMPPGYVQTLRLPCAQFPEAVNVSEWFGAFCAVHHPGAPDLPATPAPIKCLAATKTMRRRARPSKRVMPVLARRAFM